MAIVEHTVHVDGEEVTRFGMNALTTPDCGFYQQLADALMLADVALKPKSEIDIYTEDNPKPRNFQYATLKRHLSECEDVVE